MSLNLFQIGQRLKREREFMRLHQQAIADLLKVDVSNVSRIETGKAVPNIMHFQAYADATGQPVDTLFGRVVGG